MLIELENPKAERLVANVEAKTGKKISEIILQFLEDEDARLDANEHDVIQERMRRMQVATEKLRAKLNIKPGQTLDTDFLYDENGLPT